MGFKSIIKLSAGCSKPYESYIMPDSQKIPDMMETIRLSKSLLNADIGAVDQDKARKKINISGQYKKNCRLYQLGPTAMAT